MMVSPEGLEANDKGFPVNLLALIVPAGFVEENAEIVPPRHGVSHVATDLSVSNDNSLPV